MHPWPPNPRQDGVPWAAGPLPPQQHQQSPLAGQEGAPGLPPTQAPPSSDAPNMQGNVLAWAAVPAAQLGVGLVILFVPSLPWFYPLSCTETVVINWAAHFFSLVSICLAFNLSGKENPPFLEAFLPFSVT